MNFARVFALAIETPRTFFFFGFANHISWREENPCCQLDNQKNPVACGWRNDILLQMHSNNSSMVRPYPEARKYLHPLGFV